MKLDSGSCHHLPRLWLSHLGVQGSRIAVNRNHADDVYIALLDAFDAANRKLEHYARRIRDDVSKLKFHKPEIRGVKQQVIDDR